jgi:hypothetical protein
MALERYGAMTSEVRESENAIPKDKGRCCKNHEAEARWNRVRSETRADSRGMPHSGAA